MHVKLQKHMHFFSVTKVFRISYYSWKLLLDIRKLSLHSDSWTWFVKNLSHHKLVQPFFTQHDVLAVLCTVFFFIIMYWISCQFYCTCWRLWLIKKPINIKFSCVIAKNVTIRQYKTFIVKSSFILTTKSSLPIKCSNTEFFLVRIFLYSVRMQENMDQKKLRIWTLFTQCVRDKT